MVSRYCRGPEVQGNKMWQSWYRSTSYPQLNHVSYYSLLVNLGLKSLVINSCVVKLWDLVPGSYP